jgi:tetratricopeptide (TPR) repeat protein
MTALQAMTTAMVAAALALAPLQLRAAEPDGEPTAAPDKEDPDALNAAAVQAFRDRDFDGAIALFNRAYELDPQPNFLFNIGRVYEEKGDLPNAIKYYQQFVKQPGVDLEARETALTHLKALKATLAELEEDKRGNDPTAPTGDQVDKPEPEDDAAKAKKKRLRTAGYSLLGVGGGVLVIGAVFEGLAISKSKKAEDEPLVDNKLSMRQEAKGRANVGDALVVTGAVLAATGLVLVLVTLAKNKRGKGSGRTAFAPTFGAGQLGLSMTGRF